MKTHVFSVMPVTLLVLSSLGCDYVPPVTEHQEGYRDGQQMIRHARHEHGEIGAQTGAAGAELHSWFGPIDNEKSPEWNEGFYQGVRDSANGR